VRVKDVVGHRSGRGKKAVVLKGKGAVVERKRREREKEKRERRILRRKEHRNLRGEYPPDPPNHPTNHHQPRRLPAADTNRSLRPLASGTHHYRAR